MAKSKNHNQSIDPKRKQTSNEAGKTELVWPGKRKEVERVELPFQTIETINLPRGRRQEDLFGDKAPEGWKNRLIWGDNLLIMGSLLKEFAGKINLIYIDPPFATGDDFSFTVNIGDQAEVTKEPSALEVKAYRDTWGKGLQSYLQMMYDRLVLMKELLADDGSIYVHLDYRVVHYIKQIMDEIFGSENFRNEIIWKRGRAVTHTTAEQFSRMHDTILFYTKSTKSKFNRLLAPYAESTLKLYKYKDERGAFRLQELRDYSQINIKKFEEEGRIYKKNGTKYLKQYLHEKEGVAMDDVWIDIGSVAYEHRKESVNYPTQKPSKLLERIIEASSNEGDLVADFFCGSGTAGIVAEKLGRRWIMSDLGRFAIHTTRKRLLDMGAKPFVVQNLGKYERHRWAKMNGRYKDYIKFILELYHAEPVDGFTHLHGKKAKSFVRVGAVDAPVTLSEVREALEECKENKIKKLDVLGWEWEMGLHDLVKEEAEKYGVNLATLQIPREVMELSYQDAKKHGIEFYELAYLEVEPKIEGKRVTITLKDFIIPNPELLPEEVKGKVKNWSDFIDYWVVDWMFNQHEEWTEEDLPAPRPNTFYVYAIRCEDGSIYIGQTEDLRERWKEHKSGKGGQWTKKNKPLRVVHWEEFGSREEAVKREKELKTGFGRKWLKRQIESGRARQAGDTFHNMNQRYRTRKEPKLELSMSYDYKKSGKYNVLVKVIDIFGNDTTKLVEIKV